MSFIVADERLAGKCGLPQGTRMSLVATVPSGCNMYDGIEEVMKKKAFGPFRINYDFEQASAAGSDAVQGFLLIAINGHSNVQENSLDRTVHMFCIGQRKRTDRLQVYYAALGETRWLLITAPEGVVTCG